MGLIGLVGLMGSCSGSDIAEPEQTQQMPISFAGSMPKDAAVSRADIGLEDVLDNKTFKAWGYKNTGVSGDNYTAYQVVMHAYNVDYETSSGSDSNTHDWEYVHEDAGQFIKYWDFSASAYRFFAYAKGNATAVPATEPAAVTVDESSDTQVSFTSTVDCSSEATMAAAPYFSELWFSNDKVNDYGKVVTLKFVKPYARVRFMFKFAGNLNFGREELSNIKFYPSGLLGTPSIPTAGSVTVSYPLTGTGTKETWSSDATNSMSAFLIDWYETPDAADVPAGVPADAEPTTWPNTPENWYYVLPATQGTYTLEVAVVTDEIQTATVPAEYMNWKPGFEYTYVFKITEAGGIVIDVIQVYVNEWNPRESDDHWVYNW